MRRVAVGVLVLGLVAISPPASASPCVDLSLDDPGPPTVYPDGCRPDVPLYIEVCTDVGPCVTVVCVETECEFHFKIIVPRP